MLLDVTNYSFTMLRQPSAKQTGKDRHDLCSVNCLKDMSGNLTVDEKMK